MRAVVTRVKSASVTIDGRVNGEIGQGLLVLLGVGPSDTEAQAVKLADKVCGLRIFEDENEKMNLNLEAVGGALLVVSQFTLYADTKSRRPGFTGAAKPPVAIPLYEKFMAECAGRGFRVEHGEFGADMQVYSQNDGPVTILLDTDQMEGRTRPRAPGASEGFGGAKTSMPGRIHSAPADKKGTGVPAGREPRGAFGADMQVYSQNDGPVTILLDTDQM